MQRRPTRSLTPSLPASLTGVLAVTALLTLSACAGDDAPPEAVPQDAGSSASIPTLDAGEPSQVPLVDGEAWISRDDLPEPSDLVIADALDTNAPVDAASLPPGVEAAQVQALRQVWNQRASSLDSLEVEASADPSTGGVCEAHPGDVWVFHLPTQDAAPVVALGVRDGDEVSCDWRDALVLVDSADNRVLGDDAVALLL